MKTETKSTHTAGNWRYETPLGPNDEHIVVTDHCPGRIATIGKQSMKMQFGGYRLAAEEEANARLIAAAPELLAALESILEYADNGTPLHPGALVIDDARAAIAKAKG